MRAVFAWTVAGVISLAVSALADDADRDIQFDTLMDVLKIRETVEIMQDEGAVYGGVLARDMIPDVDPELWAGVLDHIYDGDKMYEVLVTGFDAALQDTDLTPILDYYQTPQAAEIVALELSARRAFLDADTEAAAMQEYQEQAAEGTKLVDQVNVLIQDSDLVELNVMGALNSDLRFYNGLNEGGAFDLSEEEILSDVWAGEQDLRVSSRDWLQAFLLMAYQPLEPDVLDSYAAFWRTEAGQDLNRAIFVAFDDMYEDLSYLLGLAIAEQMMIEEL